MKADEKRWLERVVRFAQEHGAFPDYSSTLFQIHHVCGRAYRQNKIHIGNWLILPIQPEFHDVSSNNPLNVTHYRKRYTAEFGMQRDQFAAMCAVIKSEDGSLPFGDDVYHAIMGSKF